jgi:hypothetical protein
MALREYNNEITRRYLLGQLSETEELALEERLLTEDDLYQELQLTKDELAQEYAGGQLTAKDSEWLRKNLFASPEGKQSQQFARAFDHYLKTHRAPAPEPISFWERLGALWTRQQTFVRVATAMSVLLIAFVIIWPFLRTAGPQSIASLTLVNTASTRSTDAGPVPAVKLKEDLLKLTLVLPHPSSPGTTYRFQLMGDGNVTTTLQPITEDGRSVAIEIPANQLPRGQYVVTLSSIDASGTPQRIPGGYHFKIE